MGLSIGERIRQERTRQGWDQAVLADRVGVGQQTVSGWERGRSRPRRVTIGRLAELFGVEVGALLDSAGYVDATVDTPGQVRAPVRPHLTTLPLADLTPDVFENFTADLAALLYPGASIHRQGAQGHKQHGLDVIINHATGGRSGIQCKRERQFGPVKVRDAVNALRLEVGTCFIYLTRTATPAARAEMQKHPGWKLCDVADISRAVRQLPSDSALRLVDDYFPGWREPFLGIAALGPWLTYEEQCQTFSGGRIFSHDWKLVGRDDELSKLLAVADHPEQQVATLVGRGGIGKSRLLLALAQDLEGNQRATVRFVAQGEPIRPEHLEQLPSDGQLLVIVDDAHERADIAPFLAGLRRARPGAKVLLSLRPYGLGQLASDLRQVGLHTSEVPTCNLDDLKADAAQALSREVLGPQVSSAVVQRVASIGADCPLLIVVAAGLIGRGKLDPGQLEGSDSVRDQILEAFRNVWLTDPASGDPELRRSVLQAVAVLQPFRAGTADFQAAMAQLAGRPYDVLVPHLRSMEDGGALLRRGQSLRIVPDLLGDVILAGSVVDASGIPTGYLERVHQASNGESLVHLFVNACRIDWQVRQATPDSASIVEPLWSAFAGQFRQAGAMGRIEALKVLRKVAYFQPQRALTAAQLALAHPVQDEQTADASVMPRYPTNEHVLHNLPPVIENVAYSVEYLPDALDLLWQLARHDERPTNQHPEHPIRTLCDLAEYRPGKPLLYNRSVIDAARRWLSRQVAAAHPYSPFDVLEALLATEGEDRTSDGYQLSLRSFPLNVEAIRDIRSKVVDLAKAEARASDTRRAVRAVQALAAGLRYPHGRLGRPVGDTEQDQWSPIFVEEIQLLGDLAADSALDPIVTVAIRQALHGHAQGTRATKSAARHALQRLPKSVEHELVLALHDGWGRLLDRNDDFDRAQRRKQTFFDDVAASITADWEDQELCDRLAERLAIDRRSYTGSRAGHPGPIVWTLVRDRPSIGRLICKRIVHDPTSALVELIPVVVNRLANSDPDQAMAIAHDLLSTNSLPVIYQVANALGWARGERDQLLHGEADLLRTLARNEDPTVRRLSVQAAQSLSRSQKSIAIELATRVPFADDTETASETLAMFGSYGHLSWNDLSEPQAQNMLRQLSQCPTIDDHHIADFLSRMSETDPDSAITLLMDRAEISERQPGLHYRAVPYSLRPSLRTRTHPRFPELLRVIRDWILDGTDTPSRLGHGRRIFKAVAQKYDSQVVQVLDEALRIDTPRHVRVVGAILQEAPRSFVWKNVAFATRALQAAERHGHDCVSAISYGLYAAVTTGSRWGTRGEPFQEDLEHRDRFAKIASSLPHGSIEERFYRSLSAAAESNIRWEIDHDHPADGRDW